MEELCRRINSSKKLPGMVEGVGKRLFPTDGPFIQQQVETSARRKHEIVILAGRAYATPLATVKSNDVCALDASWVWKSLLSTLKSYESQRPSLPHLSAVCNAQSFRDPAG